MQKVDIEWVMAYLFCRGKKIIVYMENRKLLVPSLKNSLRAWMKVTSFYLRRMLAYSIIFACQVLYDVPSLSHFTRWFNVSNER